MPLSAEFMHRFHGSCAELDEPEVGSGYLERWGIDNYMFELQDKWRLSTAALSGGEMMGYRVVSGRGLEPNCAHSHRTVVARTLRRSGVARLLLVASVHAARAAGYLGMTAKCHPANRASQQFLTATGWKEIGRDESDNQLWLLRPLDRPSFEASDV